MHQSLSAAATGGDYYGPLILSTHSRANGIHSVMDAPTLIMSSLALGVSVTTFGWLHLRKVDAVICTPISSFPEKESALFQFSLANLGTRPILIHAVSVMIHIDPALTGKFMGRCTTTGAILPQVIQPGEIIAVTVRSNWDTTFLCEAAKEAEKRAEEKASFFFVAGVVAWNPKGKQMTGSQQVAVMESDYKNNSSKFQPCHSVFKLRKSD